MITKFKDITILKENLKENLEAKVGDYVLIHVVEYKKAWTQDIIDVHFFLNNNYGQITSIREYRDYVLNENDICVKYFNVPEHLKHSFRSKKTKNGTTYYVYNSIKNVVVFAKTIEDLELKLAVKNFNL